MNDVLVAEMNALDAFLPENADERDDAAAGASLRVDLQTREPLEVILEPIEVLWQQSQLSASPSSPQSSSQGVQFWPMFAAALVAIGVATLALAVFAKYAHV